MIASTHQTLRLPTLLASVAMSLALVGIVALASCVAAGPDFEAMSEAELAAYNRGRPLAQMIVCTDEQRSLSRIKRRRCATVEQLYGSAEEAMKLDVLNLPAAAGGGSSF